MKKHYSVIIVGAGQSAFQVIQSLKKGGFSQDGGILLIGKEKMLPYQRPPLSKDFLYDEKVQPHTLEFQNKHYYKDRDVTCLLGNFVHSVDIKNQSVFCNKGEQISYEKIVFATGGEAARPPIPGLHLEGVKTLRNLENADDLKKTLKGRMPLIVMGGGYIGLEVAASARKANCPVTLLEREERLMSRIATPEVSRFFLKLHRYHGVKCEMGISVSHLLGKGGKLTKFVVNGKEKNATTMLLACGLKPTIPNCLQPLPIGITGGIKVDNRCRVEGYDHVFACGDITEQKDHSGNPLRLESVQNATYQGKEVATAILESSLPPYEPPWFWSRQYDVMLRVVGIARGSDQIIQRGTVNKENPSKSLLSFFALKKDRIVSVESINHSEAFMLIRRAMKPEGIPVDIKALSDEDIPLKKVLCIK